MSKKSDNQGGKRLPTPLHPQLTAIAPIDTGDPTRKFPSSGSDAKYSRGRSLGQVHAGGTTDTSDTPREKVWRVDKTSVVAYSCPPRCRTCSGTMKPNPTNESPSIFQDGKLKSGIYKIRNVLTGTYADIEEHSRGMCCRPARDLEEGDGLVRPFH